MLNGKIYEVILPTETEREAHKAHIGLEEFLEGILNKYAEAGYKVAGVWKDIIIMENPKPKKPKKAKK